MKYSRLILHEDFDAFRHFLRIDAPCSLQVTFFLNPNILSVVILNHILVSLIQQIVLSSIMFNTRPLMVSLT
ncbi:hypothetical protein MtrunA17_Chr2g0330861 [Medicago truncatula]|uniref:Transmembrane protein n=1 Tax=Medicago truncatula TaxID=3880 RepID=A0A396JGB0_MEDTR|nr:hypothetical protein MtrunA17_Chr2g0330861 [Medicago truncatula]